MWEKIHCCRLSSPEVHKRSTLLPSYVRSISESLFFTPAGLKSSPFFVSPFCQGRVQWYSRKCVREVCEACYSFYSSLCFDHMEGAGSIELFVALFWTRADFWANGISWSTRLRYRAACRYLARVGRFDMAYRIWKRKWPLGEMLYYWKCHANATVNNLAACYILFALTMNGSLSLLPIIVSIFESMRNKLLIQSIQHCLNEPCRKIRQRLHNVYKLCVLP